MSTVVLKFTEEQMAELRKFYGGNTRVHLAAVMTEFYRDVLMKFKGTEK